MSGIIFRLPCPSSLIRSATASPVVAFVLSISAVSLKDPTALLKPGGRPFAGNGFTSSKPQSPQPSHSNFLCKTAADFECDLGMSTLWKTTIDDCSESFLVALVQFHISCKQLHTANHWSRQTIHINRACEYHQICMPKGLHELACSLL